MFRTRLFLVQLQKRTAAASEGTRFIELVMRIQSYINKPDVHDAVNTTLSGVALVLRLHWDLPPCQTTVTDTVQWDSCVSWCE